LQPPKQKQGVAIPKERDTTVIATEASAGAPSSAAVPEAPKNNPVVDPLQNLINHKGSLLPKSTTHQSLRKRIQVLPKQLK